MFKYFLCFLVGYATGRYLLSFIEYLHTHNCKVATISNYMAAVIVFLYYSFARGDIIFSPTEAIVLLKWDQSI